MKHFLNGWETLKTNIIIIFFVPIVKLEINKFSDFEQIFKSLFNFNQNKIEIEKIIIWSNNFINNNEELDNFLEINHKYNLFAL